MRIGDLEISDWQEESLINYTRRRIEQYLLDGSKRHKGYIMISNNHQPMKKLKFSVVVFSLPSLSSSDFLTPLFSDCPFESKNDARKHVDQMLDRAQKLQVMF